MVLGLVLGLTIITSNIFTKTDLSFILNGFTASMMNSSVFSEGVGFYLALNASTFKN